MLHIIDRVVKLDIKITYSVYWSHTLRLQYGSVEVALIKNQNEIVFYALQGCTSNKRTVTVVGIYWQFLSYIPPPDPSTSHSVPLLWLEC